MPSPKLSRYLPPTRTSISQECRVMPIDLGAHQRLNNSGVVHASNTRRAGASKVLVTTTSRSDFRPAVVRCFMASTSAFLLASNDLFLPFQFCDDLVERGEACVPQLAVTLDPGSFFFQSA